MGGGLTFVIRDFVPYNGNIVASQAERPMVSVSCTIPWMELEWMASKLDNTWNFLASLMPSAWHLAASLYMLVAWSMVMLVGSCDAGDARHEIAKACYWLSQKVEAWASIERS